MKNTASLWLDKGLVESEGILIGEFNGEDNIVKDLKEILNPIWE